MESEIKTCQNCKKDFTIEPEDFNFYEKIKVPPPTFCPECRLIHRMSWRNERSLYKTKCLVPGHAEEIISMYDPEKKYNVFDNNYWWSDKCDASEYGIGYNFSESFFIQFSKLFSRVPLPALSIVNSVNSEYTNFVDGIKNCYLLFGSGWDENIRYGSKLFQSKDSQDLLKCTKCELCYECTDCIESYHLFFSRDCRDCVDSSFLYNCRNCSNCFGCVNLVNKTYCIWNKQYSREEYLIKIHDLKIENHKDFLTSKGYFIKELCLPSIRRYANIFSSTSCTGDNIINSKNSKKCFDIYQEVEDSKYLYSALMLKDSYDGIGVFRIDLSYECVDVNIGSLNFSCLTVYNSDNSKYLYNCHNVKDCFGCISLRNKRYCILNKQYTKKEYEELIPKIIKHMNDMPYIDSKGRIYKYGEFFPSELSPFCYNETIAQEYFPLTKEEALKQGYKWKDKEERNYQIDIKNEDIPDNIKEVDESIIGKVIECEHKGECNEQCTEAFKIIADELQFYQRMNLPLPHLCPNCRHYQRLKQRNPLKLWHRKCMKEGCENEFETSYAPDRPEIIYCERCYQQEVY
jgi:hypothetical protein